MPRSKRDKKVSLTKTGKKGLQLKQRLVEDVRNCAEKFTGVYAFAYKNLRTDKLQEVRVSWKPSRLFFGKNKVVAVALGRKPEDEVQDDIHKLSKHLKGQCGVLFTDEPLEKVVEWFESYAVEEYARAGFKVDVKVKLNEGPLTQFSHSIEPYLRQLGMPTKLNKGVVTLIKDYRVCKKGDVLTPEQARILELLDIKLATFHFILKGGWIRGKGFVKVSGGQGDVEMTEETSDDNMESDNEAEED